MDMAIRAPAYREPAGSAIGMVRTVLGDLPAADLGPCYPHEHLILDSILISTGHPHILLDDVDITTREVNECAAVGVRAMVDAMPCASGRDVLRLAEVSRRTGVAVLAMTGLHHERYYGPRHWSIRIPVETLADLFVADVVEGVDAFDYTGPIVSRTEHRAGIIKLATSGEVATPREVQVLEAVALAARRTGIPVLTHLEHGRGGVQQLELLDRNGIPPTQVVLSHPDKVDDVGYHRELAQSGAFLEYDQAIRHADSQPSASARLALALAEDGLATQIVLSTDGARRTLWHAYDGTPGLAWLLRDFPAVLTGLGIDAATVNDMFVANPARLLALRAPANP
ncbi:MAG: phosphotriesterase family protein [Cellulomonas sp.]